MLAMKSQFMTQLTVVLFRRASRLDICSLLITTCRLVDMTPHMATRSSRIGWMWNLPWGTPSKALNIWRWKPCFPVKISSLNQIHWHLSELAGWSLHFWTTLTMAISPARSLQPQPSEVIFTLTGLIDLLNSLVQFRKNMLGSHFGRCSV